MSIRSRAVILLLTATFFWGLTFVYVKEGTASLGVFPFLSYRFFLAGLSLQIIFIRRFRHIRYEYIKPALVLGILLAISYIFQTIGLQTTSATNAAFITGLFVVMVPFISPFFGGVRPGVIHITAALLSFTGMFIMAGSGFTEFSSGDALIFFCAVSFAIFVVLVGKLKAGYDSIQITVIQLHTVALMSFIVSLLRGDSFIIPPTFQIWWTVIFCAIFASSISYAIENHYQRYLSDTQAALIYAMEPVFAALAAFMLIDEIISLNMLFGAVLIVGAMVFSKIKLRKGTI